MRNSNTPDGTPARLKDVAIAAGVSLATASRVINGKGVVSPESYQRVTEAANRLAYVPDQDARRLALRRTTS